MKGRVVLFSFLLVCIGQVIPGCVDLSGGPSPGNDNGDSATAARSIDGYWFATEREGDDSLDEAPVIEFWRIRTTSTDGDTMHFEVSDACNEDEVLGTGSFTADGRIQVTQDGEFLDDVAEFTGDHEFEFDWTDDHRIVAQRIEPPECSPQPDGSGSYVHIQPIQLITGSLQTTAGTSAKLLTQAQTSGNDDPCAVVCADNPDSGRCHLCQSDGSLPSVGETKEEKTTTPDPNPMTVCEDANGDEAACPQTQAEVHAGYVMCDQKTLNETNVKSTVDSIMLSDPEELYPGALVQGGSFSTGTFTPITIPRSGGTLSFSEITFQSGTSSNVSLDEVSQTSVADAIAGKLQAADVSVGNIVYHTNQYQSDVHFAADVGADVSTMSDAVKAGFSAKTVANKRTNVIVTTFQQGYYKVSFDTPQHPWSVFPNGEDFEDPDFQIGPDNPPLYVANVTYGRQVLVFIHSSRGEVEVEAAMNAAYTGESGTKVSGHGSLTFSDILDEVEIDYVVRGGASAPALKPLAASTEGFYEALKQLLNDEVLAAGYSAANPGAPISYTLKYLGWPRQKSMSNQPAFKAYAGTYDELTCHTVPPGASDIGVRFTNFRKYAWVWVPTGALSLPKYTYDGSAGNVTVSLNSDIADSGPHTVAIAISSLVDCSSRAKGTMELLKDGASVSKHKVDLSPSWRHPLEAVLGCEATQGRATFSIDRKTGEFKLTNYGTVP